MTNETREKLIGTINGMQLAISHLVEDLSRVKYRVSEQAIERTIRECTKTIDHLLSKLRVDIVTGDITLCQYTKERESSFYPEVFNRFKGKGLIKVQVGESTKFLDVEYGQWIARRGNEVSVITTGDAANISEWHELYRENVESDS
jgi:hypothetical protein